jgi:hypothetical protein
MSKKLKILIESDGIVETLGMQAPIMTPTLVNLKTLMNVVNEGHKVKVVTPSGVNVDVDEKYIQKMIKRGDKGAKEVWEKIQEESKPKKREPKTKVNTEKSKSSADEKEEKSYTSSKKKYKKSSSKKKKDEEEKKDEE